MYQLDHREGNIITVTVRDMLRDEDYQRLVPELEAEIARHGEIRIVWDMIDFQGWTPGGMWQDAAFDLRHNDDVTRLVMIGEARWQAWMTQLMKPFAQADVRFFEHTERDAAYTWIREGL